MKTNMLYVIYEYDTKLFIELFCENKAKPQLNCDGKCRLAKMLKERQEENATKVLKQLQAEVSICLPFKYTELPKREKTENKEDGRCIYKQDLHSFLFAAKSDKPPQFLSRRTPI